MDGRKYKLVGQSCMHRVIYYLYRYTNRDITYITHRHKDSITNKHTSTQSQLSSSINFYIVINFS